MKARNLKDVKIANKHVLYDCIRKHKNISISDLEHMTEMSRPTVSGLIHEMEEDGTIIKTGRGISNGGRTPVLYSINANAYYAVGIDFEFPKIWFSITNLEYECIIQKLHCFPIDIGTDDIIKLMLEKTEELIAESGIDRNLILGIGIGLPGIINKKNQYSVTIERIKDWRNVPIADIFAKHFQLPVYLENDANLLALAEYRLNTENKDRNRMFIIIRYGVGMGIIMDGELLEGSQGNAGRLGHFSVNADGPLCVCGNRGCLALYASAHAIVDNFNMRSNSSAHTTHEVAELAEEGNEDAIHVLEEAGYYLGASVVGMTNLFDISYITICTQFNPRLLEQEVQKTINNRTNLYRTRKIELHTIDDKDYNFALGGCILVIDMFNKNNRQIGHMNEN